MKDVALLNVVSLRQLSQAKELAKLVDIYECGAEVLKSRRSGYRMSRINRILQLSFRCVDGSLWQRFAGQRLKGHRYSEVSC